MKWSELLCEDRIRSYKGKGTTGDLRTEFEKDYHRIIGSASFRRLQDKTQVFPLDKNDFIRTRLTHSMEVSSFAKSLGQSIAEEIFKQNKDSGFLPRHKADICDILQCAGLLHDIGNPPFGHFGETAIRDWFRKNLGKMTYQQIPLTDLLTKQMQEDFYQFEGNTQAFRLVTKLHFLVDEHGMNLTKALLGTIMKYPVSSLEINKKSGNIKEKKMGYFYADVNNYRAVQESLGTKGNRHPLAFILEAADDIAYRTADIEDAFKKGCISYNQLLEELNKAAEKVPEDKEFAKQIEKLKERYQSGVRRKLEHPDVYAVQNWIIWLQGRMINCAVYGFIQNYSSIMEGRYEQDLFLGTFGEQMMEALGDIAYRYVFISKPILKLEIAAETIFNFLLDKFIGAAICYDTKETMTSVEEKLMALISDNYKNIYHIFAEGKEEHEKLYLRLLLITDSICGMTDSYAKNLYQELNAMTM